ncbi:MAG: hypothetical protein WBA91_03900, partial [Paracoccaceae bacterium]
PGGDVAAVEGLKVALGDRAYRMRPVNHLEEIAKGLTVKGGRYWRSYITNDEPIELAYGMEFGPNSMAPGMIYHMQCPSGDTDLVLNNNAVLLEAVLITNCRVVIGSGTVVQSAVILSTSNSPTAISAGTAVQFGRNDQCSEGGGVQILTNGGVDFSSGVDFFGGQVIARGDVALTLGEHGMDDLSVVTAGSLYLALAGTVPFCKSEGVSDNFQFSHFRLVE